MTPRSHPCVRFAWGSRACTGAAPLHAGRRAGKWLLGCIGICLLLIPSSLPAAEPNRAAAIAAQASTWWFFQPLNRPALRSGAAAHPVDAFIDAELAARRILTTAPADRATLLRRVTFDLTGLPPTPDEVEAFQTDDSPEAFGRVVDRLLASPAYGQHFARHWLDVVRYADYHDPDPKARTASCEPTEAWRYRDWVVEAFNRDLPYDQFIIHQVAGDLLPSPDGSEVYPAGLIATGFLVNGAWDRGDADKEKMVSDMVDDQVDTIGKTFLGLTLGCARCHDHKFDPISNADYYGLAGMFYSTHFMDSLGVKGGEITLKRVPLVAKEVASLRDARVAQREALKAKLTALDKQMPAVAADHPERQELRRELELIDRQLPPPYPLALTVQEGGMPGGLFPNIQDVPIHVRGSYARLGPVVPRRLPAFFAGLDQAPITRGSGRRELAGWLASPTNALTARVLVNRVWQWHFGEGLVRTPNNLGLLSEPPSHPALLDWLAGEFVARGWSIKWLHRLLLTSAAYQRGSAATAAQRAQDPENRWLGRANARRLEAEAVRDSMLQVSGQLDLGSGGPAGDEVGTHRRSLYVQTARWDRSSFAMLFDAANPDASVEKRTVSIVAPQALLMLNHPFLQTLSGDLARLLLADPGATDQQRIQKAYLRLYGRAAQPSEVVVGLSLVTSAGGGALQAAWQDYAHVLLCSNELLFID